MGDLLLSDLTMKATTYSTQTSPLISTIIYTHVHVAKKVHLLSQNDKNLQKN